MTWITATGEEAQSGSNTIDNQLAKGFDYVVGDRNKLEINGNGRVRADASGEVSMMASNDETGGIMATARSTSGVGRVSDSSCGREKVDLSVEPVQHISQHREDIELSPK